MATNLKHAVYPLEDYLNDLRNRFPGISVRTMPRDDLEKEYATLLALISKLIHSSEYLLTSD